MYALVGLQLVLCVQQSLYTPAVLCGSLWRLGWCWEREAQL